MNDLSEPLRSNLATSAAEPATIARLNLDHLRKNVQYMKQQAAPAKIMAVVKADAYGHGAAHVAPVLERVGVEYFAVATVAEGVALREQGVKSSILVLGPPLPEFIPAYAGYNLEMVCSSEALVALLETKARQGQSFTVHVKIDTGMGRLGFSPAQAPGLVARLQKLSAVKIKGVWSHYASADNPRSKTVKQQHKTFLQTLQTLKLDLASTWIHLANSGALLFHADHVGDFPRCLVRTGIALYGYSPAAGVLTGGQLRPVMNLATRVVHLKTVEPGTPISYNHRWKAPRRTRIATLAAGYADGYSRALSNRAEVRINKQRYPVVGTICMDMMMVDLGDPQQSDDARSVEIGDRALLFGAEGPTAEEVAKWANTIPYEILCGISQRVPRYTTPSY